MRHLSRSADEQWHRSTYARLPKASPGPGMGSKFTAATFLCTCRDAEGGAENEDIK
jgi:hypothetical protein